MKFNWDNISDDVKQEHTGLANIRCQYEYLEECLQKEGIDFEEGTLSSFLPQYNDDAGLPAFKAGEWVACWDRWGFVVEHVSDPMLPFLDQVVAGDAVEFLVKELKK